MKRLALVPLLLCLVPSIASAAEVCGDTVDNDSDLMADEGCSPAAVTGVDENPLDPALTGSVAPKSGNLTYALPPDVAPTVPYGPPLIFQRTYISEFDAGGSAPAYRKSLGPRWQHNFMSWLDVNTTPSPDQAIVHTTEGRDVLFQYDSTSGGYTYWVAQEGAHYDYLRQSTSSPYNWELRTLTGNVYLYDWSSPTGKLIAVMDSLATANRLTISYSSGLIDKVQDASGKKQLVFGYTSSLLTSVNYQTVSGGTPTTQVDIVYAYSSGNPTSVTIDGDVRQTMTYSSSYLEKIISGTSGKAEQLAVGYLSGSPGKVVRSTSPLGDLGFEYGSSRASCSGGSLVYFNRVGTTACDDDSDCGSDYLCGGETNFAGTNTGVCYRAARCLQLTSPDEDLVDTVAGLPASGGCTGACASNTEYDWGTTPDLVGAKQADNTWTSYQRNSDGLVTLSARGDTDSDPTNAGGQKTWTYYGNSSFPGRVTEVRRISELKISGSYACDVSTTTDCARTLYTWNSDGLLSSREEIGFTLDSSAAVVGYDYTTSYTYNATGQLTQVDGPLSGSNDVIDYTYWSSADVLKDAYRKEIKRKKDASNYLVTTLDSYEGSGQVGSQQDPDGTYTCFQHYDGGILKNERVAMAGQTSCASSNAADLTTTYYYDEWWRLTKKARPLGNCEIREYDSKGRLSKVKERDDCSAASAGETMEYTYAQGATAADQLGLIQLKDSAGTVSREYIYTYHDGMQLATDINPVSKSYWRSYTYASDGMLSQVDFENGLGKTVWTWDALDREDAVDRYKTGSTFDEWDSSYVGQLGQPNEVEDDDAKAIETTWDDLRRKVKVISPDSGTTIFVHDAAGRVTTKVEADGLAGEVSHSFTYDNLGRLLTEDYGSEVCGAGQPVEVEYVYDASPVTCPAGATCTLAAGRLAYVRSTLLCSASYADHTLDQEVFYAYDAAGRTSQEYIRDDSGRTAGQTYTWTKNSMADEVIAPSTEDRFTPRGSASNNSDTDKVTTLDSAADVIAKNMTYVPWGPPSYYLQLNENPATRRLSATLAWNNAYRPHYVVYQNSLTTEMSKITYTEDAKGRATLKDYSSGYTGLQDSYLTYDWLDRVICDSAVSGSCPTTSPNLRDNLNGSPAYTASNDRTQLLHYDSSYGTYTYSYTLKSGKDQIDYVTTSPSTGTTTFGWDDRGNRTSDDSNSYSHDARNYTYEGRRLVRQITGQKCVAGGCSVGTWLNTTITNAYDHKGRRVFKSYVVGSSESQWFFYYDLDDQLIEVKYTPAISSPLTYSIFDFFWLDHRPIAYYQVDYPAVTTSRRYLHTDAENRVLEAWTWPTSGAATRVWALNPDAFGWDQILLGVALFQPLRGAGSNDHYDAETRAQNDSGTVLRPQLHLTPHGYYDPLSATVLQVAPEVSSPMSYLTRSNAIVGASSAITPLRDLILAQDKNTTPGCGNHLYFCDVAVSTGHAQFEKANVECETDCSTLEYACIVSGTGNLSRGTGTRTARPNAQPAATFPKDCVPNDNETCGIVINDPECHENSPECGLGGDGQFNICPPVVNTSPDHAPLPAYDGLWPFNAPPW